MTKPRKHIFVCVNQRPADNPKGCCASKGGENLRDQLKAACAKIAPDIRVSRALCLGPCEQGANVVIYPDNLWFHHVTSDELEPILAAVRP